MHSEKKKHFIQIERFSYQAHSLQEANANSTRDATRLIHCFSKHELTNDGLLDTLFVISNLGRPSNVSYTHFFIRIKFIRIIEAQIPKNHAEAQFSRIQKFPQKFTIIDVRYDILYYIWRQCSRYIIRCGLFLCFATEFWDRNLKII